MPTLPRATPDLPATLEAHVIHASLTRPVLLAGVEPAVAVLEGTTVFALTFGIGLHVTTLVLAVFYLTVVHGVFVWVATQDPQMTVLYVRSLGTRDFYFPHARVHAGAAPVRPSLPTMS